MTDVRELAIAGAWEITPRRACRRRGLFFEWFTEREFTAVTGHRFDLQQANCSVSAAGVLRGLHFAQLPPSQAKYVTCVEGAVFDVVVDIRVGSPTYGRWDARCSTTATAASVYLSEGLAHGFMALEDDSTVMYLCSTPYAPNREHTILATDPRAGDRVAAAGGRLRAVRPGRRRADAEPRCAPRAAAHLGRHPGLRRGLLQRHLALAERRYAPLRRTARTY